MIATFALSGPVPPTTVAIASAIGSAWAVLLIVVVPRIVRFPGLPLPPRALSPAVARLRRLVREPTLQDWVYPLMLGALATTLLPRSGVMSKVMLTPLPVVAAASALSDHIEIAVGARLVEYVLGAGIGLGGAFAAEWVTLRLEKDRSGDEADLVA